MRTLLCCLLLAIAASAPALDFRTTVLLTNGASTVDIVNAGDGTQRLYLVGPFQHPGGGVFGAGRATAVKVAEDLKIDLSRIAR